MISSMFVQFITSKQRYQETEIYWYHTHYVASNRSVFLIINLLLIYHWMLYEFLNKRKLRKTRKRLHSLALCNTLKVQCDNPPTPTQSSIVFERKVDLFKNGFYNAIITTNENGIGKDEDNTKSTLVYGNAICENLIKKKNSIFTEILSSDEGKRYTCFIKYRTVACPLSHIVSCIIHSLDSSNLFLLDTVIRTSICIKNTHHLSTLKGQYISAQAKCDDNCVLLTENNQRNLERTSPNRFLKVTPCVAGKGFCKSILNVDCLLIDHGTEQSKHHGKDITVEIDYHASCNYHPVVNLNALDRTSTLYFDVVLGACKAWRWPDLMSGEWLRRLPFCQCKSSGLQRQMCINPYHWNRVITTMNLKVTSGTSKLTYPMELWSQDPDLVSVGVIVGEEAVASDLSSTPIYPAASTASRRQDDMSKSMANTTPHSQLDELEHKTNHSDNASGITEDSDNKTSSSRPLLWDRCNCPTKVESSLSSACTECTFLRDETSKSLYLSSFSYSSSFSSNQEESSSGGRKAKKPRSCPSVVRSDDKGMHSGADKAWASLSYWEGHRHVGVSWYKLTCRTVRICYEDEAGGSRTSRVEDKQHSIKSICLSRLLNWAAIHQSAHTHALICSKGSYSQCIGTSPTDKKSGACQNEAHISPPLSRLLSVQSLSRLSDRHKSLFGWRLCSRFGRQGISLTITPLGQVWLNNQSLQSNMPVFVSSPCLFYGDSQQTADKDRPVFRVPPGFSLLIFDRIVYSAEMDMSTCGVSHGSACPIGALPAHVCAQPCQPPCPVVHISLGKGWGPHYRRPDITHCPARLELWISMDYWHEQEP